MGLCEIGQRLDDGPRPSDARYAKWIEMYSSSEFADLADWCRTLTDRIAADASNDGRTQMEHTFLTCSRYEWLFWQMAWTNEFWPV